MTKQEKFTLEIYLLFKSYPGAFSSVSGYLGRNDSTKLSRQLNPNDERRDNPFSEVDEILEALLSFSPELEEEIWEALEKRRSSRLKNSPKRKPALAELINRIFPELGDVVYANATGASQEDLERETYELVKASNELYENVKSKKNI